ncbi:hypothetical protein AB3Z07_05110 [Metabacillus halosaccharovorans]|uniref:hypothetical protein n=1 Tax=Metabacillus halosaccharovorans TaxID=930124 RepID=UPI0034CD9719
MFENEDVIALGFEESEIDAIINHFFCNLDMNDWESIEFIDEDEEEDDNFFKLPTGRMVYFPDELVRKDIISQLD